MLYLYHAWRIEMAFCYFVTLECYARQALMLIIFAEFVEQTNRNSSYFVVLTKVVLFAMS